MAFMAAIFVGFSSCHNDDALPPGSFTSDGKSFTVSKGFAILEDTKINGSDTYYYWSLYLTSNGINFSSVDKKWKGAGDAVLLFLTALNDDSLLPLGTYNTDDGDGDCSVYIGFNLETGNGAKIENIANTSFTINKSGAPTASHSRQPYPEEN